MHKNCKILRSLK